MGKNAEGEGRLMNSGRKENPALSGDPKSFTRNKTHGRIVAVPDIGQCLDTIQLDRLEQSFREWADSSPRADVRTARRRILIIFLLIRYTGAKLNEVLALNPSADIDPKRSTVVFHDAGGEKKSHSREI
jgi:molybdate transport system regulatory protein